uniref:Peptidase M12B domain-containing protein n=1 Tax=Scylla olivacea TaxID=85551 RepID=A0A0P4WEB2_SCYOL
MHPILSRLAPLIQPLLPCSYFNPAPNGTYGVHILHLAPKRTVGGGRAKREARRGLDEELCATGPEHDVSALFRGEDPENYRRPPKFRDVTELIGDLDLQNIEDTQDAHLEDHNHTVTANPVSAVLRRTVELAVFCDSDLYRNFPLKFDGNRESQVSNYVLTIINAVQGIYHQQELEGYVVDLRLVEMEILTESNSRNNPSSSGGDIGAYLNSFCAWQQNMNPGDDTNPKHWDHALMLSGLDLHSSGNPSVIGLAWVSGMCSPSHSCTMNEGLDFSSVYVVAHEMGHNFGMNHDGQGDASACSSTSYIMSPSVGPGKTTWSTCSARVLHSFLSKSSCLDDGKGRVGRVHEDTDKEDYRIKHYLREGMLKADRKAHEVKLESLLRLTPGYQFPLTEQCKAMYGRDYHPALTKEVT